jgi:hypothetical protein
MMMKTLIRDVYEVLDILVMYQPHSAEIINPTIRVVELMVKNPSRRCKNTLTDLRMPLASKNKESVLIEVQVNWKLVNFL